MASSARVGSASAKARPNASSEPAIQKGLPWARAAVTASSASAWASSTLPDDGQDEDHADQTGDVRQSRLPDQAGVDFQRLVDLSGVEIGGRLPPTADSRLEGVVAGISRQDDSRMGVPHGVLRAPDLRIDTGGGVEAGESPHVGGGGGVEDLGDPPDRFEPQQHVAQDGGVGGDGDGGVEVTLVGRPSEPGAQVGVLDVHPVNRDALAGPVPDVAEGDGLIGEVASMTVAHGVDRAGSGELLLGELADRLQHAVAGMADRPARR